MRIFVCLVSRLDTEDHAIDLYAARVQRDSSTRFVKCSSQLTCIRGTLQLYLRWNAVSSRMGLLRK